jgi:hypothetical protein
MRINPAKDRATAPAKRLPVLESFGREDEWCCPAAVEGESKGMRRAFWRMAFRLVK